MNSTPGGGHVPSADLVEPTGFDASGTVGLRLGRTNTDVRVRLEREWRAAVGPGRLGARCWRRTAGWRWPGSGHGRTNRRRRLPCPPPAYWTQVSVALIGYGVALAGATTAAATVVGAPVGVALALIAAGGALGVALNGLTTVTNTAIASNSALMTRFDDSTGFRGGAWPRSTALDPSSPAATSFADGSLSDGDDTDWHLQ
jgi:hypothetical protein